jgi:hypothetical protein
MMVDETYLTYLTKLFGNALCSAHEITGETAPMRKKNNRAKIMVQLNRNQVALSAVSLTALCECLVNIIFQ